MGWRVISVLVTTLLIGVNCDETTAAPERNSAWRQTGICRKCLCKDEKVDCFDQSLTTFFTEEEWADISELKPTTVDLSENLLVNVSRLAALPVQTLNLSRNAVERIDTAAFRELQALRVLDLSHNKLTTERLSPHAFEGRFSPEEFEPLGAMRVLNLAYNELHSLHQDLFEHLPELTELDLSGNPLTTLDHATLISISSLQMLKVLRMRDCGLTEIPDKFLHTPRFLERLDLSANSLTAVPQELDETKNLLYLNLNQNPIPELDMASEDHPGFPVLRKLQELHMCNMPALMSIGAGALAGLQSLQRLHLSHNPRLRYIDPRALARPDDIGETWDWPLVKEIYIQSNNLSEIDSRLLSRWDLVQVLEFSENPYLCDCSTQWMVDMLVPIVDAKNPNASMNMICQEPVEMRGYTMRHLHDIHRPMRCVDKYGHRPEKDGSILLGVLIGVLLAVPIMFTLMLLWRRGYFAWLGLRGPVDVSRAFYKRAPGDDNFI
ncbi:leucine-rich repeat neuronal protein 3-like [Aricia agestis]|uniref:leucine-rich repeat neuronal protein 3-like n=1 Tax=Aricia agestis TaxID=91739 RepID=UPI001C2032AA|nr:leucine-rich repeat neuronal protein 3-like [Aricia agestis]